MKLQERGVVPVWNNSGSYTHSGAGDEGRAIVFYFVEEGDLYVKDKPQYGYKYERAFYDKGMLEFSQKEALFVIVTKPKEVETSKEDASSDDAKDSAEEATGLAGHYKLEAAPKDEYIPVSPLESDDLFKTFNAKVGDVVMTDGYGYDATKFSRIPNVAAMSRHAKNFKKSVDGYTKKAGDAYADLEEKLSAEDKTDTKSLLRDVMKVLRVDRRGPEPVEKAIGVYEEMMEEAREQADEHVEERNVDALKAMKKVYRRTGAEAYIDAAIERAIKAAAKVTEGKSSNVRK